MVDTISEVAAKSGNVLVFKWALRNDFFSNRNWNDCLTIQRSHRNGHIKVLKLADRKELDWYSRQMLIDTVVRTDLELLDFTLKKKPHEWLREDGAPWDSHVISCAEEYGYNYVVEWARENGCPEATIS
jgi:hypothetical protein